MQDLVQERPTMVRSVRGAFFAPYYYLNYARDIFRHVQRYYSHCLLPEHQAFLQSFERLSFSAQCLLIRLCNRKGDHIRHSTLSYVELGDVSPHIDELCREGLVLQAIDPAAVYPAYTLARLRSVSSTVRGNKDRALIAMIAEGNAAVAKLQSLDPLWLNAAKPCWDWLLFLYFGNREDDLSRYVLRDISGATTDSSATYRSRYQTGEQAQEVYGLHLAYEQFRVLSEAGSAEEMHDWLERLQNPALLHPDSERLWHRLMLRAGQAMERLGAMKRSIRYYRRSTLYPARERLIRCLHKLGRRKVAVSLAQQALANPWCDEERAFAEDYLQRQATKRFIKQTTRRQQEGIYLNISSYDGSVEEAVLSHFREQGWEGEHTENMVWIDFFYGLCRDIIFDAEMAGYTNPFQHLPDDYRSPAFYQKRHRHFQQRAKVLKDSTVAVEIIERNLGTPVSESLIQLILLVPAAALQAVLLTIAEMPSLRLKGFPDLLIWRKDEIASYEVKSPNDTLSYQQVFWLDLLKQQGLKVDVITIVAVEEVSTAKLSGVFPDKSGNTG